MANWLTHTVEELTVEVAWGADILADPDTWSWADITSDVREDPGISTSLGRGDEASTTQPAKCTFTLDNTSGDYSLGGESSNWPNVRKGTPIRVSIDPDGNGAVVIFQGNAVGFTPVWDYHSVPTVELEAAGTLRRLGQGQSPVESAARRSAKALDDVIAYWPFEEGSVSNVLFPDVGTDFLIDNPPWMVWTGNDIIAQTGTPDLSSNTDFISSKALPVLKNAWFLAYLPWYSASGSLHLSMLVEFPPDLQSQATIIGLQLTGTGRFIDLAYVASGTGKLAVYQYDNEASSLSASVGPTDFGLHSEPRTVRVHLDLVQNGADIDVTYGVSRSDGTAAAATGTISASTIGNLERVFVNSTNDSGAAGILDEVAVGHLVVRNGSHGFFEDIEQVDAYVGESATTRISRLATENTESVTLYNNSVSDMTMGPQSIDTLLGLLRECELADGGILFDGLGEGLTFLPRIERENQIVDLTLNATNSELKEGFRPVDDDLRIRNKAVVTRKGAITTEFTDFTGPAGAWEIGTYDTAITVNLETNDDTVAYAQWLVHEGTISAESYRYPLVTINLRHKSSLARDVLSLVPGARVDITNLGSALTSHPTTTPISLQVDGISHRLTAKTWMVQLKCSLWAPWRVAQLSKDTDAIQTPSSGAIATNATSASGQSVTPALPTDIEPGDVMFCWATVRNSGTGTIDTPTGWTVLVTNGNCVLLARVCTGGESAPTITATGGAANETLVARCFNIKGAVRDLDTVVHASSTNLNVSQQNITVPALTVSQDNCIILICGWKQDDWTSVAALSGQGFSELFESPTTDGSDAGIVVDYKILTTAANVTADSLVVTGGANAIGRAIVVALKRDTEPLIARLDTDDSELAAGISAGATSISVTTNSGPLWTSTANDYPIDLDIGGVKITATACSDPTSPQTMTISAAPVARSIGAPVKLWQQPVLPR